jgi:hypothetical protein
LFVKVRECCFHKIPHVRRQNEADVSEERSKQSVSFLIYGRGSLSLLVDIICVKFAIHYQTLSAVMIEKVPRPLSLETGPSSSVWTYNSTGS